MVRLGVTHKRKCLDGMKQRRIKIEERENRNSEPETKREKEEKLGLSREEMFNGKRRKRGDEGHD